MEDHKDAQRVTMGLCDVSTGRVLQLINPRRECVARVTVVVVCVRLFICLFVCLRLYSHYRLRQPTRWLTSHTNSFSATRARKTMWRFR